MFLNFILWFLNDFCFQLAFQTLFILLKEKFKFNKKFKENLNQKILSNFKIFDFDFNLF